ncbi:MAG TPA: YggT family protein [Gemmatimonadaceae bacterium]|nr:YggT family protein [Gemmatimonadaceae bacterium]
MALINAIRELLRVVLLSAALAMAVIAVIDWMVRTRRIGPFSPVARFFRQRIDPLLEPVERRVIRAGGLPANAPWWALAGIAIIGIVLLALLDFVAGLIADVMVGVSGGPGGVLRLLVYWTFTVLRIAILVRVIASWLPISPYSRWIRWSFTLSEPLLRPLRRVIPPFRSIDLTPIIAFFALGILEAFVREWLR